MGTKVYITIFSLTCFKQPLFCFQPDKCIIKGIPSNVNIRNYNEGDQLSPGQKVQLSCRIRSHVVQGKSEIHCLANGQWSHPFPTCGGRSLFHGHLGNCMDSAKV